jgi:hypothetical protein
MQPEAVDRLARELAACTGSEARIRAGLAGVTRVCPQWRNTGLLEVDGGTGTVTLLARHGPVSPLFESLRTKWPLGLSPARELLKGGVPRFIPDMRESTAFPLYRLDADIQDYRSVAMLLLRTQGNKGFVVSCHSTEVLSREEAALPWLQLAISILALALGDIDATRHSEPPGAEVHPAVLKLAGEKRADMLETARAFALHDGRFQRTADALGIHVSTLRYRLNRLRERLDIDLLDRDIRHALLRSAEDGSF